MRVRVPGGFVAYIGQYISPIIIYYDVQETTTRDYKGQYVPSADYIHVKSCKVAWLLS